MLERLDLERVMREFHHRRPEGPATRRWLRQEMPDVNVEALLTLLAEKGVGGADEEGALALGSFMLGYHVGKAAS